MLNDHTIENEEKFMSVSKIKHRCTMVTRRIFVLLLHYLLCSCTLGSFICPDKGNCVCPDQESKHFKLKCFRIQNVEDLNFRKIINVTLISQLDLSNNSIKELPNRAFPPLPNLNRLNLDKNEIEVIHEEAFGDLSNLKRLILSNNKLKQLHKNMFKGLTSVNYVKLNQNLLTTLANDTFDFLPLLKTLDITGNPWICNCDLWWLESARFKLNPIPKCDSPLSVHDQPVNKNELLEAECEKEEKTVYSLNIFPDQDQIVFEGDTLKLICQVSGVGLYGTADQLMSWSWEGNNSSVMFDNNLQFRYSNENESDIFESSLTINDLYDKHTGEWTCNSLVSKFNQASSIRIKVLSGESAFCEVSTTETDKGRYTWPETIVGQSVELPCEINKESGLSDISIPQTVTYLCSSNGSWVNLNTDDCPYTSTVTRILLQFSKMNLTNHKESLIESATRLRNFTTDNLLNITHVRDIHFIVMTIENYIIYLENQPELGYYLIEIVNSIVKLPKNLLERAQQQHMACSRLIESIELITKYSPSLEFLSNDFALREITVSSNTFVGLTCWWTKNEQDLSLNCSIVNKTLTKGLVMEASIHIPTKLLHDMVTKPYRLVISSFEDSRLFPDRNNDKESSLVIGANIIGAKMIKLEEPISITLRNEQLSLSSMLVWWNVSTGQWSEEGCQFTSNSRGPYLKFICHRLGYFSLVRKPYEDIFISDRNVHRKLIFNFLHPSVYVGTFICVTCLILAVATYCFCYTRIQMSKKMKHSLANTWLSASLLFLIFSVEIHQTDHQVFCEIIGLSIHYFALATLFWMTVTIKALYKRVHKSNPTASTPSEDIPADVPIEKPILGIYLVGWGISAIICGIASAVNIRGYANPTYCFLTPGPALSTVLIPASLVLFYLLIMCLLVKCAASGADSNPQLSVGTQAIDLDLLDGGGVGVGGRSSYTHVGCNSVRSVTTPSSQAEDTEHSPIRQLKAFVIFLVFYLLATVSAAACVMTPLWWPPYEEKVFSFVYATVCVLLGAFVLFFHCFARNDVRSAWNYLLAGRKVRRKSPHIIANSFMPTAAATTLQNHQTDTLTRPSNGQLGPFDTSAAVATNMAKSGATMNNNSARSDFLKQTPNINLVRLHRQHYRGFSTLMADGNFYNPHQSIVAKKFFKKQRKKRISNTLQNRRCRSGGSSPVSTMLFNGGVTAGVKKMPPFKKSENALDYGQEEKVKFLLRPNAYDGRYDEELSSEKHPLTYDEPDITGCEEAKTGTESEATFTVPEYAEIQEQNLTGKYADLMSERLPPPLRVQMKEQMCGTSDHDWCSCDAVSDNSEPTYNYAYIRNRGYASSQSVISDNSSGNSHLYTSVVPDVVNSVDRYRSRLRPRPQPPRARAKDGGSRSTRQNYKFPPPPNSQVEYGSNNEFKRRRKEEGYKQLQKDLYHGLSPSSDFSSEDKVETCV